jgi:integrase
VPESGSLDLSRFAGVMTTRAVEPAEVTEANFEDYRDYLRNAAVRNPDKAYHGTCVVWARVLADKPEFRRSSPPRAYRRSSYWRAWSEFPPGLEADVDAYHAGQARPQSVDRRSLFKPAPGGRKRGRKGIKASTIQNYKNYMLALASAAVQAGIPADSLISLEVLVSPEVHEKAIEALLGRRLDHARQQGVVASDEVLMKGNYVYSILHHVRTILVRHFGWPEDRLDAIDGALESLAPKSRMSQLARQRITVLREPNVLRQLSLLPHRLYDELHRVEEPTQRHAWTAASGLLLAIAFDTAFRRSNIILLRDENFGAIDKKTGRMPVEIMPEDAKTEQPYMSELRPRTVELLTEFQSVWRRRLGNEESRYLIPVEGLDDPDQASRQAVVTRVTSGLTRLVRRRLDVDFCLHDLRRVLATIYAEGNPGDVRTAQLKLGHQSPEMTERFYIAPRELAAIRHFDAFIEKIIDGGVTGVTCPDRETCHEVF